MVDGVSNGFTKKLEIVGIGYRAEFKGKNITLSFGFSHPIIFQAPPEIDLAVDGGTWITVSGFDKQLVGQVAAIIRSFKKPEPYKGKGIKYDRQHVRRKAGTTGIQRKVIEDVMSKKTLRRARTRTVRHRRVRKKIQGTSAKPRWSVFRSLKHIHAQVIDDTTGTTLIAMATDTIAL